MENEKNYRIAYATGSRAEYGIVKYFLERLSLVKNIDLELLVTGTHLEKDYGYTIDEIISDGFNVTEKVQLEIDTTDNTNITTSMSIGLEEFGKIFAANKYDLLIILGDRYEMLSVAISAAMNRIPILHIHGGEKTLGNYDEFIRHSITKMSQYHFTSTESYRNRVIQLGENPSSVFNLGALGATNAVKNVDENFEIPYSKPYIVILFHPETLTNQHPAEQMTQVIEAVDNFKNQYHLVFIGTNADTYSNEITSKIREYCDNHDATYLVNVENRTFQNLVAQAELYVGNSSSGIIEAPTIGTYSINIGNRQLGRIQSSSTIDSECNVDSISEAINKAIVESAKDIKIENPYYQENALDRYVETTVKILKENNEYLKDFYDIY